MSSCATLQLLQNCLADTTELSSVYGVSSYAVVHSDDR